MNQIKVDEIITFLKSKSNIKAITGERIYFGQPITDDLPGLYITINILGEQQSIMNKGTLLEFRFIAHNDTTTFSSLLNLKNLVSNELYSSKKLSNFYSYNCYEDGGLNNGYDEKNRKVIIQDYRFYFLS